VSGPASQQQGELRRSVWLVTDQRRAAPYGAYPAKQREAENRRAGGRRADRRGRLIVDAAAVTDYQCGLTVFGLCACCARPARLP
jgi:hypothetical protein